MRDTQRAAYESVKPLGPKQRAVLALYHHEGVAAMGGATADEIASALGWTPFTVRPRVCELVKCGLLVDSGFRRDSRNHHRAIVWRLATDAERQRGTT